MPDISIVVPAYNEVRFIRQTLARLVAVTGESPISVEIIVVDNCSTDCTSSLVSEFEGVHLVKLPKRLTISAARNSGATLARGALLAFVDADVLVTEEWARNLDARFDYLAHNNVLSGAQYRISERPGWIERYWFKAMEDRRPNYINGGNLIVGKHVFDALGGFKSDLVTGEDVEICRRAQNAGIAVEPDARFAVHHEGYPKTLGSFFKRELWTGRGDYSSITAFVQSKTAVAAAVVFTMLLAAMACVLAGLWIAATILVLAVAGISMASVTFKYGAQSLRQLLVNSAVMIVHLIARAMAFIKFEKKP